MLLLEHLIVVKDSHVEVLSKQVVRHCAPDRPGEARDQCLVLRVGYFVLVLKLEVSAEETPGAHKEHERSQGVLNCRPPDEQHQGKEEFVRQTTQDPHDCREAPEVL